MYTETHQYRGYEIQVTNHPPIWQAAIYASEPGMTPVDWELKPINGGNVMGTVQEAKRRIDKALSP
jgi:hypothetical protein